ncbi:MAG TPA: PAS domain S-box protein [Candidatus Binatia bacterium]|nr:PAS domain S-box protein [Candidatus Binatia bacterium]
MSTIQGTSLSDSIGSVGTSHQLKSAQLTKTNEPEAALRESKFRLQLALESANIGIYELNLKNGELLWDERVRTHWGLTSGAPVDYNTFLKGVHPDDREATQAAVARALDPNGDGRCRVEFRVIGLQDGIERWIAGTGQVFFENRQAERLVGTTFDITGRKRAEQRLRESEERFRTLADSSPVPIWVTDATGGIEFLNAAYCDFFGVTIEDVRGPKWATLLHPDDVDPYVGAYYDALRERKAFRAEARVRRRDGEWRWVDTRGVPRFSEGGEFLGHVGSSPDVTEMKIAQEALRESEEQFRASFEISTVGMAQGDPITGRLLRVNRRFCEMTGYSESELLELSLGDITHPEDRTADLEGFQRLGRGEAPEYWAEKRYLRKDGKVIWVAATANLVRNWKGQPMRTVAAVIDITGRKQAEAALRESEAQFRASFESAAVGQAQVDPATGRFERVNQKFCEILGYSEEELLTMTPADTTHPEDRESYVESYPRFLRGEIEEYVTEKRDVRKDQTVVWVSVAAKLIRDSEGRPLRTIGVLQDITERKRAEEELRKLNEELEARVALRTAELAKANETLIRDMQERQRLEDELRQAQKMESIGTLAGGIAHDFNNLLNIILGYLWQIERGRLDPVGHAEAIDVIKQTVMRGASVVQQLLTMARKSEVKFEWVDLNATVSLLAKLLKQTFPKEIELTVVSNPTPPVLADSGQITQALLNICLNARDAMPLGGQLTIRILTLPGHQVRNAFVQHEKDLYVCLEISDTGSGMDDSIRSRIFEPFFTTKGTDGTGLGLAVVYGIVQTHSGFIDVATAKGKGTTFRLYLPAQATDDSHITDRPHEFRAKPDEIQKRDSSSKSLLLVEDESHTLLLVKRILEDRGYTVFAARDGEQALELHRRYKDRIALVMLDLGLPKISGREVFLKMREIQPELKVIVASGYLYPELKTKLLGEGVKAFIEKPYNPQTLFEAVSTALQVSAWEEHP